MAAARRRTMIVFGIALLTLSTASLASAAPSSRALTVAARPSGDVARAQSAVAEAAARRDAASKRVDVLSAKIESDSARLDALVAEQAQLEDVLNRRANGIYRSGPLRFFEVLFGSASFDQFVTRRATLLRVQREQAAAIRDVDAARADVSEVVERLLQEQTEASRALRSLDSAEAQARRDLASAKAARAASLRRASTVGANDAASRPRDPISPTRSSAPWKSAVASWYGTGSYGVHLASGVTIGPDSMIVAHKTLPIGSVVEFSYRGRYAVAKVMDRGPYYPGREFDLGPGTARVLGFDGVDTVRYRVLSR